MEPELWDEYDQNEVFEYLDKLRDSGETNMFGARPYLQAQFAMSRTHAGAALSEWMQTFGEEMHTLYRASNLDGTEHIYLPCPHCKIIGMPDIIYTSITWTDALEWANG